MTLTPQLFKVLALLLPLAATAAAATYGPPLIARSVPDRSVGNAILFQQIIPQGETVLSFAWFNNNPGDRNWITPLVLQLVSGDSYRLVGIGEGRRNTGAGIQRHPFNLKYGSALATGPNFVFGWWSGQFAEVTLGGVSGIQSIPNANVVPLDPAASTPGYRESCPRPNVGPCSISINPFLLGNFTFANIYAGPSTGSLASPFGRLYSIQFESAEVPVPAVTSVISLSGFGGAPRIAPGGWVEIFGSRFTTTTKQWAASDFSNDFGPTVLDGVRVSIDGKPAFISFVSPGQINCVAPDGLRTGMVDVVVTNSIGSNLAFPVAAAPRVPSLLAPPVFKVGGKQYVVALHPDQVYAGPEKLIDGVAFRPAVPGDKLVMYATSFGETIPALPAGKIVSTSARFPNMQVRIGDVPALVEYAGPVAGLVGLSQLNVVIPGGAAPGDARLTVSVDGVASAQELWTTIQ